MNEQMLFFYTGLTSETYEILEAASAGTLASRGLDRVMRVALADLVDPKTMSLTAHGWDVLRRVNNLNRLWLDGSGDAIHGRKVAKIANAIRKNELEYLWFRSVHVKLINRLFRFQGECYQSLVIEFHPDLIKQMADADLISVDKRLGGMCSLTHRGLKLASTYISQEVTQCA